MLRYQGLIFEKTVSVIIYYPHFKIHLAFFSLETTLLLLSLFFFLFSLVSRSLVCRSLVSRSLVSRSLVSRSLVSRSLVSRSLVFSLYMFSIVSISTMLELCFYHATKTFLSRTCRMSEWVLGFMVPFSC